MSISHIGNWAKSEETPMATRFEYFGRTSLGLELGRLIDTADRYIEFRAFSREGFPAVTALVSVLSPVLEPLRRTDLPKFKAAKQFVGWFTGEIMRRHGHTIIQTSKSVPGKLFTVGALWSAAPTAIGSPDANAA
jgi:hypothetical protein